MSRTIDGLTRPNGCDETQAGPAPKSTLVAVLVREVALLRKILDGTLDSNDFWRQQLFDAQTLVSRTEEDNRRQAVIIQRLEAKVAEGLKREQVLLDSAKAARESARQNVRESLGKLVALTHDDS